jgi:surface polysaccharide O-acyltransferase-like enzyme
VTKHYLGLDYLRALLILRVVGFHSVLAYAISAQTMRALAPIVDAATWGGFDIAVRAADVFGMPLLFFISGLFVWPSLNRKGAKTFALGRSLRLGVPFAAVAALVMPLAYYPAYRAAGMTLGIADYWSELLAQNVWQGGPLWFIWLLLVFDLLAAGTHRLAPRVGVALAGLAGGAGQRPLRFFAVLVVCALLAYLPFAAVFGPRLWVSWGPFGLQPSRVLHYAVYFIAGLSVGACGLDRGLLGDEGLLMRRWKGWVFAALGLHIVYAVSLGGVLRLAALSPLLALGAYGFEYVLTCAATAFALLAVFQRFLRRQVRILDSLAANSYGIYLGHYFFVLWGQYLLLDVSLPAGAKAVVVFSSALALSWLASAVLRRIPALVDRRALRST